MDSIYFFWLLLHNHFQRGITTYVIFQQLFLNKGNVVVKLNGLFKNKFPNYIYYVLPVITYYTITITTYITKIYSIHCFQMIAHAFSNWEFLSWRLIFLIYIHRSGIPTWFSGTWNQPKNEFIRQIEQGVSSFFRILT